MPSKSNVNFTSPLADEISGEAQTDIHQTGHDLQQLLKNLKVGSTLSLPESFQLPAASQGAASLPRKGKFGDVHQAWRYGGKCQAPTDQDCEQQLLKVLAWIQGELK